jgi:hypothetical protein
MDMQNTHPVLAVLVAAVVLPPYQLQHLPTMQQNLERFYRSVTLRLTLYQTLQTGLLLRLTNMT